ncbi:MAG: leucine-rich repeat domain-containing protein [Bacteroidales bacterium]|nr:leucine-rich repeat domain-containing protein [Bacteroidales bacterium]
MNITIPKGITRIAPMILDDNCRSWHEKEADQAVAEYPLYEHAHIERLVIPESVDIPHAERFSPFASYKQRPFVCNQATHCQRIEIACIENHSPHLLVEDGVLYSADKSRLIYCFEEKRSFVVPQSVTTIEPYAFSLQHSLAKIILHDDITFIGDAAFMACGALEEVLVPKQIKKISDDCFDGCTSLSRVVLPDGLEAIGRNAFRQCKALKQIKLPDTLIYIRGFEGCSALQEIEIPAGVERINDFMFCSSLRKVRLHEGVKRIDDYAFRYCANLTEINFPEGLEYVGARAFYPASLAKLVFPASLQAIGCEAFYHNAKLRSLEFRSANTKIDQAAFACCPLLFKRLIRRPDDLQINDDVFEVDSGLDKYGFWD